MSEKPLKQAINQLLRAYGYGGQLDEMELLRVFEEQIGKMYVNHTKEVSYKDKMLYIHLDSASLKQELSYAKEDIKERLNKAMGKIMVEKIMIK